MKLTVKPLVLAIAMTTAALAQADGQLEGRISDSRGDTNYRGAVVSIDELKRDVLAGPGGRFRIPQLQAGEYTLSVRMGGQLLEQRRIVIADNETLNTDIQLNQNDEVVEEVLVIGQAAQMQRAIDRQRFSDNMISAINADAIGQLPDNNAAEALQRVPGVSIERDQGEGRFVRVRGISPDLNSVTVNGTQLPAPEAGSRAVALDVIPSDLIGSLVVTKTLTPDMDANAIGGSIEVESLSALDREGAFYTLRAEASYDEHTDQTSPAYALSGGDTLNLNNGQRLGVAGAFSYDQRKFGSDNVETGGAWVFDGSDAALESLEQRDYTIERERIGAALNLDYELDMNNRLFLRTLFSSFKDSEQRYANAVEFGVDELNDDLELEFSGEERAEGDTGLAEVSRELKDRTETQEMQAVTFGGEHFVNDWTIGYAIGHSQSSEDEQGGISAGAFSGEFDDMGFRNTRKPHLLAPADFYDPAEYELDEVEYTQGYTEDTQNSVKLDITRDFFAGNYPALVKFGGKLSQREKEQDINEFVFEDFTDNGFAEDDLTLDNFTGPEADYQFGRFGNTIRAQSLYDLINSLDKTDFIDEEASRVGDYRIEEDINAAYVMGRVDINDLRILGGLRYEKTDLTFAGTGLNADDDLVASNSRNDYDHVLPSLHIRYALTDSTLLRAAWSNSVVRPTFEQMSPSFTDDGEEAELGNPALKALESSNIDLSLEHYTGTAGLLSASLFHKDIKHFVYETDLAGSPEWAAYDEVITYRNGDDATLTGVELAFSQKLTMLPAPFDGLLISANTTLSESDATISTYDDGDRIERDISLPSQSDVTGNFIVGYEKNGLMVRLAANYKSGFLLEAGDVADAQADIYQDDHTQLDFSSAYDLNQNLKLTFDISNLTDEPYYAYQHKEEYNAQYEEYGPTYRFGVSYTGF